MRPKKELHNTIMDNYIAIEKIFCDEMNEHSIDLVESSYLEYEKSVILNPGRTSRETIPFDRFDCIYFLMIDDYVEYVGQTTHLCHRISNHVNDGKKFTGVTYCKVNSEELLMIEAFNIAYHTPLLNTEKPKMKELILMVARKVR